MRESNIREALTARIKSYGGEERALKYLGRNNCPDVLVLLSSRHLLVETKRPKKKATEAQAREHDRLRRAGFHVFVITTLEELDSRFPPV